MCIVHLEESNANRKIDAHDPILNSTGEIAVEHVGQEGETEVDVESGNCCDPKWNIADPKEWQVAMVYQDSDARQEQGGPDDDPGDDQLAVSIEVDTLLAVVATSIDETHFE